MKLLKKIAIFFLVLAFIAFIGLGITLGMEDMNRIVAQSLFNIMCGMGMVGILFFGLFWLTKED